MASLKKNLAALLPSPAGILSSSGHISLQCVFHSLFFLCCLPSSWPMQRLPAHVLPFTPDLCPLSCADVSQSLSGGAVIRWRALRGL